MNPEGMPKPDNNEGDEALKSRLEAARTELEGNVRELDDTLQRVEEVSPEQKNKIWEWIKSNPAMSYVLTMGSGLAALGTTVGWEVTPAQVLIVGASILYIARMVDKFLDGSAVDEELGKIRGGVKDRLINSGVDPREAEEFLDKTDPRLHRKEDSEQK